MNAQRLKVLLVDDEEPVLVTTEAILSEDFDVQTARDAASALEILEHQRFDVLCTDFHMPGGNNGIQLLRAATVFQPHLAGVLVTGYREYLDRKDRQDTQGLYFLVVKPFQPPDLIDVIHRAAEAARVKRELSQRAAVQAARGKWGRR